MFSFVRLRHRLFHLWFLVSRPMTLGVRVLVEDGDKRILLVRHVYVDGWYLPGGGVEKGDTLEATARKEVEEETGIRLEDDVQLLGMFLNAGASKRDHVGLYACRRYRVAHAFEPNREIAEIGFFSPDALPKGTTPATCRRLEEWAGGKTHPPIW